jgi:hypothetical protein
MPRSIAAAFAENDCRTGWVAQMRSAAHAAGQLRDGDAQSEMRSKPSFSLCQGISNLVSTVDKELGQWAECSILQRDDTDRVVLRRQLDRQYLQCNADQTVQDCYHDGYADGAPDGSAWTTGDCSCRITRGGSWASFSTNYLRSFDHEYLKSDRRDYLVAFRVGGRLALDTWPT